MHYPSPLRGDQPLSMALSATLFFKKMKKEVLLPLCNSILTPCNRAGVRLQAILSSHMLPICRHSVPVCGHLLPLCSPTLPPCHTSCPCAVACGTCTVVPCAVACCPNAVTPPCLRFCVDRDLVSWATSHFASAMNGLQEK